METEKLNIGDWVCNYHDNGKTRHPETMVGRVVCVQREWSFEGEDLITVEHIVLDPLVTEGTDFVNDTALEWMETELCKITEEEAMMYRIQYG